jgi:hypothetical protein
MHVELPCSSCKGSALLLWAGRRQGRYLNGSVWRSFPAEPAPPASCRAHAATARGATQGGLEAWPRDLLLQLPNNSKVGHEPLISPSSHAAQTFVPGVINAATTKRAWPCLQVPPITVPTLHQVLGLYAGEVPTATKRW